MGVDIGRVDGNRLAIGGFSRCGVTLGLIAGAEVEPCFLIIRIDLEGE